MSWTAPPPPPRPSPTCVAPPHGCPQPRPVHRCAPPPSSHSTSIAAGRVAIAREYRTTTAMSAAPSHIPRIYLRQAFADAGCQVVLDNGQRHGMDTQERIRKRIHLKHTAAGCGCRTAGLRLRASLTTTPQGAIPTLTVACCATSLCSCNNFSQVMHAPQDGHLLSCISRSAGASAKMC